MSARLAVGSCAKRPRRRLTTHGTIAVPSRPTTDSTRSPGGTRAGTVSVGISADQVAARAIGHATRLRSLQIGCEAGRQNGQCDSGYACAYSSNISWSGPRTPVAKEIRPRLVFDRLFRSRWARGSEAERAERVARERSILDLVSEDAQALQRQLGRADGDKLAEYLESVFELERRIERLTTGADEHHGDAPPRSTPKDFGEHVKLLNELLVLAFQTDQTRVATFLMANEGSGKTYPFLELQEGHHALSHHKHEEAKIAAIRDINRYHVELFTQLVQGLQAVSEGDGTLLDNVMLVYGSGIADGNRHTHHDLPILLAGGRNARLAPGSHQRFERETPLNNLHLALLERVGAGAAALGDSSGVLTLA